MDSLVGKDHPVAACVELASGSRLLAGKLEWKGGTVRITRPGSDAPLAVAEAQVCSIEIINGRWQWLDSLTPLLSEHRPFLTVRWPTRFGVNVAGGPLRLGATTYTHGLGVHSSSMVIFETNKAQRFHCLAGVDAGAGGLACVDIQVRLDGRAVLEKKGLRATDDPVTIDLPLNGAQKLELRVDYGANGDVQDRFNWADAALVK